jgi:hypothetical protein
MEKHYSKKSKIYFISAVVILILTFIIENIILR